MVLQSPKLDQQFPENRENPSGNNTFFALSYDDTNNTAFVYNDYVCGYYEVPAAMRAGFKKGARNLQAEDPDEYWKLVQKVMDKLTAKKNDAPAASSAPKVITSSDPNFVYDVADVMPSFPGGQAALMQYLAKNIKYPVVAEENGIQGRVICTFVVGKDGSISNVQVMKGVDPSLDKEAVRVVSSMPNWIPGKQNGQSVNVKYTVPVMFKLQ